jgi:hypothetical protein
MPSPSKFVLKTWGCKEGVGTCLPLPTLFIEGIGMQWLGINTCMTSQYSLKRWDARREYTHTFSFKIALKALGVGTCVSPSKDF